MLLKSGGSCPLLEPCVLPVGVLCRLCDLSCCFIGVAIYRGLISCFSYISIRENNIYLWTLGIQITDDFCFLLLAPLTFLSSLWNVNLILSMTHSTTHSSYCVFILYISSIKIIEFWPQKSVKITRPLVRDHQVNIGGSSSVMVKESWMSDYEGLAVGVMTNIRMHILYA